MQGAAPGPCALPRAPASARPAARRPCTFRCRAAPQQRQEQGSDSIAILGAGPAGLAAAVALQQAGLPVHVLERRPAGAGGGTALGLWTNAWRALDALGVAEPLRQQHPALDRVELCRQDGRRLRAFSLDDCEGGPHEFRGVQRSGLLEALEARLRPGTVRYGCSVAGVEAAEGGAAVLLEGGQRLECLAVVAADGGRSVALRAAGRAPPNYAGQTAIRGIAQCNAPPPPCIRQVWGQGPRAGAYPISEQDMYWFVCFDDAPGEALATLRPEGLKEEALRVVKGWGWGIPEAVEATPLDCLVRSRIADRWDLPSLAGGGPGALALAGDALHPMTPNLGQGGGVALEDAVVLGHLVGAARTARGAPLAEAVAELPRGGAAARVEAVAALRAALQAYERSRLRRALPVTVKSWAFGALLQLPAPPVVLARDLYVQRLFSPAHFLSHTAWNE